MINKDGGDKAVMRGDIELLGGPLSPPPPAIGKTLSFVKICTYVKLHVITFERDKSIILIEGKWGKCSAKIHVPLQRVTDSVHNPKS